MPNQILSLILKNTYTLHDLKHRLRILKAVVEQKLFGTNTAALTFSPEETSWLNSLGSEFIAQFNEKNVYTLFGAAEKAIENTEAVILYLPFQADQATVNQLGSWFRQNLTNNLLFDIKLDPNLIGGCALVRGGIYKDYSLKSKIYDQRDKILTEFRKYFR